MYKETCKTTKFIYFKIQKYSLSISIQYHSDTVILFLKLLWHGYCLMGNTNLCCPVPSHRVFPWDSHRNEIPMDKPAKHVMEIEQGGHAIDQRLHLGRRHMAVDFTLLWQQKFCWGAKQTIKYHIINGYFKNYCYVFIVRSHRVWDLPCVKFKTRTSNRQTHAWYNSEQRPTHDKIKSTVQCGF